MPRVCSRTDEEIVATYDALGSYRKTADHLGVSPKTVKDRVSKRCKQEGRLEHGKDGEYATDTLETDISGNKATVVTKTRHIKTVEDALDYAKIDTRIWEVDRVTINSWETAGKFPKKDGSGGFVWGRCQLWQVKVTLKRRIPQYVTDSIDEIVEGIRKYKPIYPKTPRRKSPKLNRHMLEVSLFDSHFGKLCWGQETGADYDIYEAERIYHNAVDDILLKSSHYHIDKILYPIGNDFFHVNNWDNTTARGTPQDVDARFQKVFKIGCDSIINAINRCLAVAPVDVIWVPGNHDPETSFYLTQVIDAWFHQNKNVNIDTSPKERKYVKYGVNLIGFTHGDEEKHADLPGIMAGEVPDLWASTTCREWHLGHFHKKKATRFAASDTHAGIPVVVLPSLSGTDKWHYKKGYVNNRRAAVGYLWDHDNGYSAHMNALAR